MPAFSNDAMHRVVVVAEVVVAHARPFETGLTERLAE